jgi:hypothetical protein
MALETGTYINDLVITNPPSNDPKSQGDDHLRLLKTVLKNSLPGFTGIVLAAGTEAAGATASDYVVTLSPAPAAYPNKFVVVAKATHANIGAATWKLAGLAALTLKGVDGAALAAGDIESGSILCVYYDGTDAFLISGNDRLSRNGDTLTGTYNFTTATLVMPQKVDTTSGTALNLTLTGIPVAPTAPVGTMTTQVATTDFVAQQAFTTNLPGQSGNTGKILWTDGSSVTWQEGADFARHSLGIV